MEKYRRDIDGLRAVAVIPVVLYHAGVKWVGGGYIGVDVFFVISGYLITRYVDQKIQDRRFSILEFYERRVRRIMPALFFVLLVCFAVAYFALLPNALYDLSKNQIASAIFSPNILLYYDAGYFDGIAKLKPLLHMWSLGVEEQFYIFLPLTLVLAARGGRKGTLITLYGVFIASLVASVWMVKANPNGAFYLVPYRAWELLLGSLLAVGAFPQFSHSRWRETLAAIGLLLVITSVFVYNEETPFPGAAALLPCVGAALVIYGNESGPTLAGRLLSWRPMVGIGLISYSLYLWHWPLLVFPRHILARPLTLAEAGIAVLAALAVSITSWKYVEQPFRRRKMGASRLALFSIVAAAAAVVIVCSAFTLTRHGLPQRLTPQARVYASGIMDRDHALDKCTRSPQRIEAGDLCRLGSNQDAPIDFVVWGDSHAGAVAPAFKALANETGTVGWLATQPGCAPLLGVETYTHNVSGCDKFNASVASAIERYHVRTVYIIARWEVNLLGRTGFEISEGLGGYHLADADSKEVSLAETARVFERGLNRTLARVSRDARVVLFLDVPNTAMYAPAMLAKSANRGVNFGPEYRVDVVANGGRLNTADDLLERVSEQWHVATLDPKLTLCQGPRCLIAKDGHSMYTDDNHLTTYGAMQLIGLIRPSFSEGLALAQSKRAGAQQESQPASRLQTP